MNDAPDYLTTAEVAALLRVSRPTVIKAVRERGLPAVQLGRVLRFARVDVDAWLQRQREESVNGRRSA
jgi:excisionase family DNA binding protein